MFHPLSLFKAHLAHVSGKLSRNSPLGNRIVTCQPWGFQLRFFLFDFSLDSVTQVPLCPLPDVRRVKAT